MSALRVTTGPRRTILLGQNIQDLGGRPFRILNTAGFFSQLGAAGQREL